MLHQKHDDKKEWDEKTQTFWLNNLFHTFVKVGELVPVDHKVTRSFFVPRHEIENAEITSIVFQIFHSDFNPFFTTEKGVSKLGNCVCVAPTEGQRGIKAVMHFGDTEIRMEVIPDDETCPSKDITVKFSCK
ncbi:hypothetical protein KIPB_010923 [Kipferlia bialata]|uniref:Uncharacterized protein n=1 Tax=Kipferlia bialata TaxID=797122 RepID=A0A391NUF5_9EUKA|nr:hypothetical protein KIPB_010923 [Kipferlia bialata]|eukprot:g10923.t1